MFRYQLKAPMNAGSPCRAKSSTYAGMSSSVSQAGRTGESGMVSRRPKPSGNRAGLPAERVVAGGPDQEAAEGHADLLEVPKCPSA